ncbi:MAG: hypothetical protein ACTSPI_10165 [Candidatus Heimdallarchaeaceae archaeon]
MKKCKKCGNVLDFDDVYMGVVVCPRCNTSNKMTEEEKKIYYEWLYDGEYMSYDERVERGLSL